VGANTINIWKAISVRIALRNFQIASLVTLNVVFYVTPTIKGY